MKILAPTAVVLFYNFAVKALPYLSFNYPLILLTVITNRDVLDQNKK